VADLESQSDRVIISCNCKGDCSTKRCRCFKEDLRCSVHCHIDDHNCGNLSDLTVRTEMALGKPRTKRKPTSVKGVRAKRQKVVVDMSLLDNED
jgi:hypothetical protein